MLSTGNFYFGVMITLKQVFWEYFAKIGEDFPNNLFCIYLAKIINNVSGMDTKTKSLPKTCILKFVI